MSGGKDTVKLVDLHPFLPIRCARMNRPANSLGSARIDLLDPFEVSRLGGLELVSEGVVEGFLTGLHRSPRRGFSVEFAEHRMYQPGDELRYVDWKILGRNDRLYVKQFEEETNLRAMIVTDISKSMAWSGSPETTLTKLEWPHTWRNAGPCALSSMAAITSCTY